jgi:hypothetical protein
MQVPTSTEVILYAHHPKFPSEVQFLTGAKRSLMAGTVVGENVLNNSANNTPKPSY